MFSTLRTRFGIPGVISVIALVFAMFGGAYAASNSGGGSKAAASAKAKKGPKGAKGATGAAGPAGPAGSIGPAGPKGDAGATGSDGTTGTTGAAGKGVVGEAFEGTDEPVSEPCEERGGVEFKSASPQPSYACNGAPGQNGRTGFTDTLPEGKTETGAWSLNLTKAQVENTHVAQEAAVSAVSFSIPLTAAPENEIIPPPPAANPQPVNCPGEVGDPQAVSGWLCFYAAELENVFFISVFPVYKTGAHLVGIPLNEKAGLEAYGTFAVTG